MNTVSTKPGDGVILALRFEEKLVKCSFSRCDLHGGGCGITTQNYCHCKGGLF